MSVSGRGAMSMTTFRKRLVEVWLCLLRSTLVIGVLMIAACGTVPVTGRQQFMLVSESEEAQMGLTAYREILSKENLSRDRRLNALVQRVGKRIAAVANRPDYQWEF